MLLVITRRVELHHVIFFSQLLMIKNYIRYSQLKKLTTLRYKKRTVLTYFCYRYCILVDRKVPWDTALVSFSFMGHHPFALKMHSLTFEFDLFALKPHPHDVVDVVANLKFTFNIHVVTSF